MSDVIHDFPSTRKICEMNKTPIDIRSEILFLYDVTDANPNGDPNDENRPRMDDETGRAKVSDVRLKRTIRDYLHDYGDQEIFCRQIEKPDGTIQDGKDRAEDFFAKIEKKARGETKNVFEKRRMIEGEVLRSCIDVRLFGATIPVGKLAKNKNEKDSSVTLTGPVQFAMGTTLHRVEPRFIKGTGAFASGQGSQQKTFREEYVLPYALISFYGIVNQQAAKATELESADVEQLLEGIWYGTKNLITRSKLGQRPLLLLVVEYKKEHANSYIGRLDRFVDIKKDDNKRDEELRDVSEVAVELTGLKEAIEAKKNKIEQIRFAWDKRLQLSEPPEKDTANNWTFLGCRATELEFE